MAVPDQVTSLALRAGAGDRVALADFVRATQADVWRLCAHLVDRAAADDLTQETYLRTMRGLRTYRGDASGRTFVLAVARHTCVDELRRRGRQRSLLTRLQRAASTAGDAPASDTGGLELDQLVAGLDRDRREAFVLTQVLGMGYAEAAEVCGCPVGTIRSRVARARAQMIASVVEERPAEEA